MLVLDHIAVAAETLAEGAAHVEAALGVELSDIGSTTGWGRTTGSSASARGCISR
jgi:hypothetical protein